MNSPVSTTEKPPFNGRPAVYHIPVCPFCQRIEVMLDLKGKRDAVDFHVVDITVPRPEWLLGLTGGTTALPVMETDKGPLKESLVLLDYIEDLYPDRPVKRTDPYEKALEALMVTMEGGFVAAGYMMVMNQDREKREEFRDRMDAQYKKLDDFLVANARHDTWLFEDFGFAEAVYTPFFQRFWFLDYYENYEIPAELKRVRRWHDAAIEHPAAQQTSYDEIVKLYYDYAKGAGNGGLLPGREKSSFTFDPDWTTRPMPPRDKFNVSATDKELGLV
ncbi:glutathione S-transferase family protein [Cucumibacter marinus]|uniref:glutathione S-transferase family protein n=1 Tax=Cucumibacter marinus TaxID=1121252 RepID=UPI00042110AB|nr:glutathione S-transferase family protein [Cucumibacter marinus]